MQKQPLNKFYKKVVLNVLESLYNKVAGLHASKFFKKRLQCRCFPVNIAICFPSEHLFSRTTAFLYFCAVAHDSETYDFTKLYYDPMNLNL